MNSTLHLVSGSRLQAVDFVADYTTFVFGELVFAALAHPILVHEAETLNPQQPGYRDALFEMVGQKVTSTFESPEKLEIVLENGDTIIVPLDAPYPPGPEMATLSGRGTFIAAWLRAGI